VLSFGILISQLAKPLAGAACCGLLFPWCFAGLDPLGFKEQLKMLILPAECSRFVTVWWIHLGIYAGFMIGLIWGARAIHRGRRSLVRPSPPDRHLSSEMDIP
jgi:hypothetical protein